MIKRLPAMAATTRNTLAQLLKVLYLSENELLFSKNDRLLSKDKPPALRVVGDS
jgi:hypothetical protein